MTPLRLTARSVREEMRHIIRRSEPDVIIGSEKDQKRRCKKDKDHVEFLCDLYEPQKACGRYIVHELTLEVNSRMKCVTKIMAMPGTRTTAADLCMFRLAACDEGAPGFVNASVRTITNARQVGMRMQRKCTGADRHARVNANNTIEKMEQTGTRVHQVARAMEEHLREDQQELKTREQKKKAWDCS